MVRDLKRRSWVVPEEMSGFDQYLPEMRSIVQRNRELAEAGQPLRFPYVELSTGRVTLAPLDGLEIIVSGMEDLKQAALLKHEIAQRRQAIKRDGFDTLLRAALVCRYGFRIREAS
jgi:hypothetical protein